jgi:hypothetical protein
MSKLCGDWRERNVDNEGIRAHQDELRESPMRTAPQKIVGIAATRT